MKQAHREEIRVPGMPEPISHFTHVVRAGRLVFVSGCVASDENGKTVGGGNAVPGVSRVAMAVNVRWPSACPSKSSSLPADSGMTGATSSAAIRTASQVV